MARILYIQDRMKNKAGMERILTAKINYLAQHTDHHLFLLTYEQSGAPLAFELDKSVQYIPIDNIIPLRKDYSLLKWLIKYLNARKQFRKNIMQEIEQTNPDIIICSGCLQVFNYREEIYIAVSEYSAV